MRLVGSWHKYDVNESNLNVKIISKTISDNHVEKVNRELCHFKKTK